MLMEVSTEREDRRNGWKKVGIDKSCGGIRRRLCRYAPLGNYYRVPAEAIDA